ncbi:MAG: hypothetical protein H7Y37_13680 [Anaerolineae bacterium]|nr:hypothetical protein [Gloeobacterales cyanobacterium ES-bin-313]
MPTTNETIVPETEPVAVDLAVESAKTRSRKPKKNSTEQAIDEIKALVSLKLQVQKGRKQATSLKDSLSKLFSPEDITEEEADLLLREIDNLSAYVQLRRDYLAARERAKPALEMLVEAEMTEEEVMDLT